MSRRTPFGAALRRPDAYPRHRYPTAFLRWSRRAYRNRNGGRPSWPSRFVSSAWARSAPPSTASSSWTPAPSGTQPTEAVEALLKITGDWQKFKGLPGAEGTLKVKEPKPSKQSLYEAALAAAGKSGDDTSGATTARKKAAPKKDEAPADTDGGAAAAESTDADADATAQA